MLHADAPRSLTCMAMKEDALPLAAARSNHDAVKLTFETMLHADAPRSLTCMAMEEGALLVQIPQRLFLAFVAAKPRTLQIYLQKVPGCARVVLLWLPVRCRPSSIRGS